ncbi:BTAD domain-containing putative transcriptional regulator [uncultured Streptomyces sp.]|uniref:AfsR/SARP family transcriptional regulator n=1 Tax=uncultured Streptomyces sp. TaxID=174707 RepID=UPI0026208883|nr:BTAD domain-containing putative transcriptional regulator [uncultured Streptomyces sp.]
MAFEIRILGSVELMVNGSAGPHGTPKQMALLAALAVDAGRPVSKDALIHRLWDDDPPGKPGAGLHAYITKVRGLLAGDAEGRPVISQSGHAYTLVMDPDDVDWHRFQRLGAEALTRADEGDDEGALSLLREADGLWRGEPLEGMGGLWAQGIRRSLTGKRLAVTLTRVAVELRRGRYAELVPDLSALLDTHPTDETLAGHLMVADYGCGRMAEALRVYETVRRRLSEEFGTEPGEALSTLHGRILNRVPVAELFPGGGPALCDAPYTLPSHGELVGRQAELAVLRARPRTGAVFSFQAVSGMGGVGKTLLALHTAAVLAPQYPDGQIYLDLGAHAPGAGPLTPEIALGRLLRDFGVPAETLPRDLEGRTALWRTLLRTKRAVIVLDDAAEAAQVAPLLPGSSPSLVIITSRRRIAGLPGVRPLFLDELPAADARTLFRQLIGPERVGSESAVAEIVQLCGNLPLAVEIAAGRLNSRPSWTTSHLLEKLSREHGRLGEIRDGYREVTGVFMMSYKTLPDDQKRAFRLMALHPGSDFTLYSAAALTGLSLHDTERSIEALLDGNLLKEPSPERYRFHDLLGRFARELDEHTEGRSERHEAMRRVIEFSVHACEKADVVVSPRRPRVHFTGPPHGVQLPDWRDAGEARRWLGSERSALVAVERAARAQGLPEAAARLAHAMGELLDEEGLWSDARRMHAAAARHWKRVGEPRAEILALIDHGAALSRASRYEAALAACRAAIDAAEELGDTAANAEARHRLGVVLWNLGRLDEARVLQRETLRLRLLEGDILQIARAKNNLGITYIYLGKYAEAGQLIREALNGFRAVGDAKEELRALMNLGDLFSRKGDRVTSRAFLEEALGSPHAGSSPLVWATGQVNLANALEIPAEAEDALTLYREAYRTFTRLGDRRNAAETLHRLGVVFAELGDDEQAVAYQMRSLALASEVGAESERVVALRGMGAAEGRLGRRDAAVRHLGEAGALARRIGAAGEVSRVESELAVLLRGGRGQRSV